MELRLEQIEFIVDIRLHTFQLNAGTSITSASTFSKNATYLLHLKMNDAASSIRVNGSNEASGAIGVNSFNRLNVGTNYNADQGLDGAIGEIVFATGVQDIEKIEGYLAHKWGLDANLPVSHSYKSESTLFVT